MAATEETSPAAAAAATGNDAHPSNDGKPNDDVPSSAQNNNNNEAIDHLLSLSTNIDLTPPYPYETITKLDLFQCNLSSLPSSLPDVLPNLSILFAMKNAFTEMPSVIGDCPKLQMVSFKSNALTSIHPDALQSQMRWLILTDNRLEQLPSTIGRCTKLQKLMLSGNRLTSVPDEMRSCTNLELVRLASNHLVEPPMTLLRLPKLAWVALSDNPFLVSSTKLASTHDEILSSLPVLTDPELDDPTIGEVLGTGASGITHRKTHQGIDVAVKTYVGQITSDGNPDEERKISLLASSLNCPNLIKVLGQTAQNGALVMEYLDGYTALAKPPSLESCSRDVYDDDDAHERRWTANEAINMISGLLDALTKLHDKGICHGDFYGHNILVPPPTKDGDKTGGGSTVKLSDFGAAFLYDKDAEYGRLLVAIERRALGHLVDEVGDLLLARTNNTGKEDNNESDRRLREEKEKNKEVAEAVRLLSTLSNWCTSLSSSSASDATTFAEMNKQWGSLLAAHER